MRIGYMEDIQEEITEAVEAVKDKKEGTTKAVLFCFTEFDMDDSRFTSAFEEYKDIVRGIAWGREITPSTGVPHLQGFIQVYSQMRYKQLLKWFGIKWMTCALGNVKDNENYCKKEGFYTVLGEFVHRGYRTDWHNMKDDFRNGASLGDIAENYTGNYIRYHAGIKAMKYAIAMKDCKDRKIVKPKFEIWKGKNIDCMREVYALRANTFIIDATDKDKFIFDGYDNETTLVIKGFVNGHHIEECEGLQVIMGDNGKNFPKDWLEEIIEGIPQRLKIKNGQAVDAWNRVILCSNLTPDKWYCGKQRMLTDILAKIV